MKNPSSEFVSEAALEPALPICDAHHHLWERAGERYLLADFLQDAGCGHNVVATVAIECRAMYRKAPRANAHRLCRSAKAIKTQARTFQ